MYQEVGAATTRTWDMGGDRAWKAFEKTDSENHRGLE